MQRWELLCRKMGKSEALTHAVWEWVVDDLTKKTGAHKDLNKFLMDECIECGVGDLTKTGCCTGSEIGVSKMKRWKKIALVKRMIVVSA